MEAVTTPCRIFRGEIILPGGHGRRWFKKEDGTRYRALIHRWVYEQVHGPQPPEVFIRHKCDVAACFRYDHLEPGTRQDNVDDMTRRQRQARGARIHSVKLTENQAREIKERLSDGEVMNRLANEYGVNRTTIMLIRDGKTWSYL